MFLADHVFVIEVYTGHGYRHLVHHLYVDLSDDGWWGAKLLCTDAIVDRGKLPVRDNNFSQGLPVTCLTCVANTRTSPSSAGNQ